MPDLNTQTSFESETQSGRLDIESVAFSEMLERAATLGARESFEMMMTSRLLGRVSTERLVPALLACCKRADEDMLSGILGARDDWSQTLANTEALMCAVSSGAVGCAIKLVQAGSAIQTAHVSGAIASKRLDMLKALANLGAIIESEHVVGAASSGDLTMLGFALSAGGDPNGANKRGTLPILAASKLSDAASSLSAMRMLLEAGAYPDGEDAECLTALHRACARNHREAVRLLLAAGAEPYKKSGMRHGALGIAAGYGHEECALEMLAAAPPLAEEGWQQLAELAKRKGMSALRVRAGALKEALVLEAVVGEAGGAAAQDVVDVVGRPRL